MAFTEQNAKDGYLFFAIAFNAVPGKTYAAQVVEAYNAGMSTQQIVNVYTTKAAFTNIYGSGLSNADFAQAFVTNVTAGLTIAIKPAVLTKAIADVTAALNAGLTVGDVIYNVITNISKKPVTDADWGPLVQMLQNKVAVAQALTEGQYAIDSTDVGALKAPLAGVTDVFSTIEQGINKGASLLALVVNDVAAKKAVVDYAKGLGLTLTADEATAKGGSAKEGDAVTKDADVNALLKARLDSISTKLGSADYAAYKALSATSKAIAIESAKTTIANTIALDKDAVTAANTNVAKVAGLAQAGAARDAAVAAKTAADVAAAVAAVEVTKQATAYNTGKLDADQVAAAGANFALNKGAGTVVIEQKADSTFAFAAGATPAQKTGLTAFLNALNDNVAKAAASVAATTAATNAGKAVKDLDTNDGTLTGLLDIQKAAQKQLTDDQKASDALNKALTDLATYAPQYAKQGELTQAVADANQKLVDAGYTLKDLDGGAAFDPTVGKIVSIFDSASKSTVVKAGFSSDDHIFVGSSYTLNAAVTKDTDLKNGDSSKLEVFFVKTATGTDVYIEQKAFGSNEADAIAGNGDIAKITLTGVATDKVSFKDGFITVAA